jgi:hypothetical protein
MILNPCPHFTPELRLLGGSCFIVKNGKIQARCLHLFAVALKTLFRKNGKCSGLEARWIRLCVPEKAAAISQSTS